MTRKKRRKPGLRRPRWKVAGPSSPRRVRRREQAAPPSVCSEDAVAGVHGNSRGLADLEAVASVYTLLVNIG